MNTNESISDFVDLYLSIDLSRKEMDLIKIRSLPKEKSNEKNDDFKITIESFRSVIAYSEKHFQKFRARSSYSLPENLEDILHLHPRDFFLLLGYPRYNIESETISLILKQPPESLQFKLEQLRQKIPLTDDDLKNIHLKLQPLETKRYSQIQKLKNKFRPQKFLIETTVIMFGVITLLWSLPELRNRYEKWIQKKTTEYFISGELKDSPMPIEYSAKPSATIVPEEPATVEPTEAELATKAERKQPKVVEGEVWRFSFTGSAKIDLESELKRLLQKHTTEVAKSSIAPGGIQYDVLVKVDDLIALKQDYEALSDSQAPLLKMSWYKKKNMGSKKIPNGQVEVIIWISTI